MERDDAALSAAIAAGDAAAEEELFHRFQPRVRCLVETALRHGPDCEDVVCVILEGVIQGLRRGRFRGESRLSTYVYAVAHNKIAEYFRRRPPETTDLREDIVGRVPAPDEEVILHELDRAVQQALEQLKPKYRTVLYLHYYRQMAIGEIAQMLGVPPRRVSEWKDYGLEILRSRFAHRLDRFR